LDVTILILWHGKSEMEWLMGPLKANEGSTDSTRERLIEATAQHLATKGPRGVEMRAMCLELGISPSLVNYHFASTGELLWLAALHAYDSHVSAQYTSIKNAKSGAEALENWLRASLAWKQESTGVAAVIDYPMLAFTTETSTDIAEWSKLITDLSRRNVATLGSAVFAVMTGRKVAMLSTQRVALLIKLNREFAFWVTVVGFGGQGAATWIAGRRPSGTIWRIFGFSPTRQIDVTIAELIDRASKGPSRDLAAVEDLAD
jgi:hypothetical protein